MNWKGGVFITPTGYRMIKNRFHPFARRNGYVLEHRLIMEQKLGRYLKKTEAVHHLNGDKLDNRPENLEILTYSEHGSKHSHIFTKHLIHKMNKICKKCGSTYFAGVNTFWCENCRTVVCETCNKRELVSPSRVATYRFCSSICYGQSLIRN